MSYFNAKDIVIKHKNTEENVVKYKSAKSVLNQLRDSNRNVYEGVENLINDLYRLKSELNYIGFQYIDIEADNYETLKRIQREARQLAQSCSRQIYNLNNSQAKFYTGNRNQINKLVRIIDKSESQDQKFNSKITAIANKIK